MSALYDLSFDSLMNDCILYHLPLASSSCRRHPLGRVQTGKWFLSLFEFFVPLFHFFFHFSAEAKTRSIKIFFLRESLRPPLTDLLCAFSVTFVVQFTINLSETLIIHSVWYFGQIFLLHTVKQKDIKAIHGSIALFIAYHTVSVIFNDNTANCMFSQDHAGLMPNALMLTQSIVRTYTL